MEMHRIRWEVIFNAKPVDFLIWPQPELLLNRG